VFKKYFPKIIISNPWKLLFVYMGIFLFLVMLYVPFYGIILLLFNFFSFGMCVFYLIKIKKSQPFTDFIEDINLGSLMLLPIFSLGFFYSIYLIRKFHKYPLTTLLTREELDRKIKIDKRDRKIKKILG